MIEIIGTHGMWMQLQARQVRHPRERRRVARHDFLGGSPGWKLQRDDFYPVGPRGRSALLIEELLADPVRIAHEHVRTPAGSVQRPLRYGEVVASKIELGVSALRKQHLVRIG